MTNNLKKYFPLIRERSEVLADIASKKELQEQFNQWTEKQQEEFLDFCTGARGVKMLYDSFFKEVANPEYSPERLNDFLSVMLKQKVKILHVLPNDSVRIALENSLLITDLVVELEDGSIANIEIQKIGYMFPGERAACYSADLLLRQYKRVRDKRGKQFTYKDIKPVYTIVLYEHSPREFHLFPEDYIHYISPEADTGLKLNMLQRYVMVPLDIFRKKRHNEAITNKVDAWLTFLSMDEPEEIVRLITAYPEFKPMYEDIYELCRNRERVIGMFSKELQMLDENTVQYMIDEMQDKIDEQQGKIDEQQGKIDEQQGKIDKQQDKIDEMQDRLEKQNRELQAALETIEKMKTQK
ncbi:MAG: PD-(D/E)XK nuclease family transposase [Lachnospiraceae bacterium]|nr:PD-(D/E)XK nuclease family transposase [Lachnospiraceae bacterium]